MHQYKSAFEREAAPFIASLGGHSCESFAPLLADTYEDASDAELIGKPDSLIPRGGYTFIETKDGVLNNYRTKAESTEALRYAYGQVFGRCGDCLSESKLSTALYEHSQRGQILARDAAWNHSLFKVAALQAKHGYQRYLVVFKRNPSGKDAARYCAAGLVWCTLKTLPDFLRCKELMRQVFTSRSSSAARTTASPSPPTPAVKGLQRPTLRLSTVAATLPPSLPTAPLKPRPKPKTPPTKPQDSPRSEDSATATPASR